MDFFRFETCCLGRGTCAVSKAAAKSFIMSGVAMIYTGLGLRCMDVQRDVPECDTRPEWDAVGCREKDGPAMTSSSCDDDDGDDDDDALAVRG